MVFGGLAPAAGTGYPLPMRLAPLIGLLSCLGCTAFDAAPARRAVAAETVTDPHLTGGDRRVVVSALPANVMVSFRAWSAGPLAGIEAVFLGPDGTKLWEATSRGTALRMDGVRTGAAGDYRMVVTWTTGDGVGSYRFDVLSTAPEPFRVDRLYDLAVEDVPARRAGASIASVSSLDGTAQRVLVAGGYSAGTATRAGKLVVNGESVLIDPVFGKSKLVGGLATGRAFAGTARLDVGGTDFAGKVMVFGGIGANGAALSSTEVYDPKLESFGPGPTLPEERAYLTAMPISGTDSFLDGKVVLVGGERTRAIPQNDKETGLYAEVDENPKDVWYFDPTTAAFQRFTVLDEGRVGVVPVQLSDGRLFFIGGGVDTVPSAPGCVERADNACRCNPGGQINLCTDYHDCVDGICAYTNFTRKDVATRSIEIYDTATGSHKVLPETAWLHRGRVGHSVVVLPGDRILVAGGATALHRSFQSSEFGLGEAPRMVDSVELFEPETATFRILPPLAVEREGGAMLYAGQAGWLLVGGQTPGAGETARTTLVERYVPGQLRFEAVGNVGVPRWSPTLFKVDGADAFLVIGGEDADGPTAAIELVTARNVGPVTDGEGGAVEADVVESGDTTDTDGVGGGSDASAADASGTDQP